MPRPAGSDHVNVIISRWWTNAWAAVRRRGRALHDACLWQDTRQRRTMLVAEVILIGLVGCWLGLLAGVNLTAAVDPLQTKLSVQPSLHVGSVVSIPPL